MKVHVDGERIIATAEGNGPVNALDSALRAALVAAQPELERGRAVDYKVRILAGRGRHRRRHPGAGRRRPTARAVDHGRRARQRRRGVLAGAGRRRGVRGLREGAPVAAAAG